MMVGNIRSYYRPLQPTVTSRGNDVMYQEYLPNTLLHPYIYCYWELKTLQPLKNPFLYRVVADGCIDIFFERTRPTESFVMGFCKSYAEFRLTEEFHYIGIRFLPTTFPLFFHSNASELSNRYIELSSISSDFASFLETHFFLERPFSYLQNGMEEYLLDIISGRPHYYDDRFYNAVQVILEKQGLINVTEDLKTGLSNRQLRRLFAYYIGDSPKTFSKVVRFQNILQAKPSTQSLRKNKLFYDLGYCDQAHFIKDFKNFYGVTPAKAFGR